MSRPFALPDGGFRTVATQVGEVTAVSADELALESEDGFTRTYRITEDTMVNAGRDEATAQHVSDLTNLGRFKESWSGGR